MIKLVTMALALAPIPALAAETRCGWLSNPTPQNFWLRDGDQEWTLSTQGGDGEVPGFDRLPDMSTKGWVETNGSHGYGCACVTMDTNIDDASRRVYTPIVKRIYGGRPVPLRQCRADKTLPAYEDK